MFERRSIILLVVKSQNLPVRVGSWLRSSTAERLQRLMTPDWRSATPRRCNMRSDGRTGSERIEEIGVPERGLIYDIFIYIYDICILCSSNHHSFHVWSSAIFGDGTGCGSGAVAAIGGLGSVAFDPKAAGAPWCVRDIQRHTEIPSGYD